MRLSDTDKSQGEDFSVSESETCQPMPLAQEPDNVSVLVANAGHEPGKRVPDASHGTDSIAHSGNAWDPHKGAR